MRAAISGLAIRPAQATRGIYYPRKKIATNQIASCKMSSITESRK